MGSSPASELASPTARRSSRWPSCSRCRSCCSDACRHRRPAPDAAVLYQLLRGTAAIALRWYYSDIAVQGAERVPRAGPLLILANHPNALIDPLLVGTAVMRRVLLTAKATLFEQPALAP